MSCNSAVGTGLCCATDPMAWRSARSDATTTMSGTPFFAGDSPEGSQTFQDVSPKLFIFEVGTLTIMSHSIPQRNVLKIASVGNH